MAIETDFEIQNDRDIRYIGVAHGGNGAGYHTVLAFHEWLRDKADDAQAAGQKEAIQAGTTSGAPHKTHPQSAPEIRITIPKQRKQGRK